jgi:hypothetical protein
VKVGKGNETASLKKPTASLGQPVVLQSGSPCISLEKCEVK